MKKRMEALTVETTEQGQIVISQDDVGGGEPTIIIDPSQVPLLVQWLQEAAAELGRE